MVDWACKNLQLINQSINTTRKKKHEIIANLSKFKLEERHNTFTHTHTIQTKQKRKI